MKNFGAHKGLYEINCRLYSKDEAHNAARHHILIAMSLIIEPRDKVCLSLSPKLFKKIAKLYFSL
jgi:hypothetical protein